MDFEKRISVYRGDVEESIHYGAAAVVNSKGDLIYSVGNPDLHTFPRSSLKFLQAVALIETGAAHAFQLTPEQISLSCASHVGESIHSNLVNEWLHSLGLNEDNLACGLEYPADKQTSHQIIRQQLNPSRLYHNCSGKHTGFLTVCQHMNFPTHGYHLLEHPVQQLFVRNLSYFTQRDAAQFSWQIDGCGFPTPALKLRETAYAMARYSDNEILSESKSIAVKTIQHALTNHPEYMSGTQDIAAHIIRATKGDVLVKIGAEGFFIVSVPKQKIGMALKIADGSNRGIENFLISLLVELELLDNDAQQQLIEHIKPCIYNSRDEVVGSISQSDNLN